MDSNTERCPDEILPEITSTQSWCCENGCGVTTPKRIDFEYWRAVDAETGELFLRRVGGVWVSACCEAQLELYDEALGDFTEWSPANANEIGNQRRS